jgi:hypothetical protein
MKEYTVERADGDVPLAGDVDGTPWDRANAAAIEEYPWDMDADRQPATVRALYDDAALYLQYLVEDAHSAAEATELNGPVWEDSAVECFFGPDPDRPHYVNFEANCVGTFLMGWGPDREHRERIAAALAEGVRVETSIAGPTKTPSPDDESWWLAAALPFETLSAFTGREVRPAPGAVWRGNFQRLGGGSEHAVWNPIDAPEPDFHRPESFGRFTFA